MQGGVFALHPVDHLRDTFPAGKLGHGARRRRIVLQRRAHQIFHAVAHLVELLPGLLHFLPLHVENRQALAPVLVDRLIGPRIAVNGRLKRRLPPRPLGQPVGRRRLPQAPFPFRPLCALL